MTEKEKKRLDEILDEATKQEEVVETKKETDLQEQVAKESNRETPIFEGIYSEIKDEEEKELSDFSTRRVGFIFVILGVVALALVIILCIVISGVTRKDKQEVATKQQPSVEVEAEEQPTIVEEEVIEVVEESTPEPTAEPTPEPTEEPIEIVSWEEWASQPGETEPHLVVWNEENGTQLIVEPYDTYTLEEGDKLAVSASLSYEDALQLGDVYVSSTVTNEDKKQSIIQTEYGQYWEVLIEEKGTSYVYYAFKDSYYNYFIENP